MATVSQETSGAVPEGWYPNGDVMQWWDGAGWADRTQPPPESEVWRPGWYPNGNVEKWWDGMQWTDRSRPLAQAAAPVAVAAQPATTETASAGALVPLGYITAVVIPVIGFILGIVVATRPAKVTSKHGAWIILVSIIAFVIYLYLIVHSAQSTSTVTIPTGNS